MRVTLKDVAKTCDVDISTASRALRDDPLVKQTTRQKVKQIATQMGYRPNLTARSLQTGTTQTVWFIVSSLESKLETVAAETASRLLSQSQYDTLVALHHQDQPTVDRMIGRLSQGVADGAIIIPSIQSPEDNSVKKLVEFGFPLVFLDRQIVNTPTVTVTSQNAKGAGLLCEHCINAGSDFLIIHIKDINEVTHMRCEGAIKWCKTHQIPFAIYDPNVQIPKTVKQLGLVSTAHFEVLQMLKDQPAWLKNYTLRFGVFDGWPGEPYPLAEGFVCKQDFPMMARRATEELMQLIEHPQLRGQRKIIHIPIREIQHRRGSF
ncbi:MAG: LacI family DNA-binding transcriptional regulator [Phycisphaeraceae bacterium]|nr:LacI family DNA-binding transcriptional regulator [Phycisphaeraceae bacterium]